MSQPKSVEHWLRASQHRWAFAQTEWRDLQQHYGSADNPNYWRQRQQRMAYQYAIVEHLLAAANHMAQAVVKQLANTRFDDIGSLTWPQIETLLVEQAFLSPAAQELLIQIQSGDWADLIGLQAQSDYSLMPSTDNPVASNVIAIQASEDFANPDHWPVQRWLRDMQHLFTRVRDSLQEF
ncbi:MAG: hypothetical protein NZ738_08630 [Oceanospirillaceae bacterium]|jgi:hypothetical protein|nr:hypothetical protein [Oceanospirillaceae bacterium]